LRIRNELISLLLMPTEEDRYQQQPKNDRLRTMQFLPLFLHRPQLQTLLKAEQRIL